MNSSKSSVELWDDARGNPYQLQVLSLDVKLCVSAQVSLWVSV